MMRMTEKQYRVMNHDDYELDYIADSQQGFKKVDLYDCCDLLNENEQLKQFKEKVFNWIDKEIARNEEAIRWGKETGADSGSIGFYNHMLKRLKKELSE